jgi:DNA mismatch repair protein MutL
MEGYGQRLMRGRYPQAVIFIEIDPSQVDVNVHPTKQEVRFRESQTVYNTIVSSIEKALHKPFQDFFGALPEGREAIFSGDKFAGSVSEPVMEYSQVPRDTVASYKLVETSQSVISEAPQIIGQLGNTYIICQVKDGLFMLDQHAAHERVVYENLKKGMQDSRIEIQNLLVPFELELSMKEKRIVLEKGDNLSRFGLDLEHFGGNTFLLRSHPVLLKNVDWNAFLSEVIVALEEGDFDDDIILDRMLTVMACHGAIRAGQHMTHNEMTYLLRQLEEMDLPTNCPHGRPIFRHLTYHEIERMFRRVV